MGKYFTDSKSYIEYNINSKKDEKLQTFSS